MNYPIVWGPHIVANINVFFSVWYFNKAMAEIFAISLAVVVTMYQPSENRCSGCMSFNV